MPPLASFVVCMIMSGPPEAVEGDAYETHRNLPASAVTPVRHFLVRPQLLTRVYSPSCIGGTFPSSRLLMHNRGWLPVATVLPITAVSNRQPGLRDKPGRLMSVGRNNGEEGSS